MIDHSMGRWITGIIHLHSKFSDGVLSLDKLKYLAQKRNYRYMIVTDHAEKAVPRLEEYCFACARLSGEKTADGDDCEFVAIPGLEIASSWEAEDGRDRATSHTLVMDVTGKLSLFSCPDSKKMISGWSLEGYRPESTRLVQAYLHRHGLVTAPAHQFQYTPLKCSASEPLAGSDFRYDMSAISESPHVDFYYRSFLDMDHESEDLALYTGLVNRWITSGGPAGNLPIPWAFTSSDFHLSGICLTELLPDLLSDAFTGKKTPDLEDFDDEQFSHATWVFVTGPLNRNSIVEAISRGSTCAVRGRDNTIVELRIEPVPGITPNQAAPMLQMDFPVLQMDLPCISVDLTFSKPTTRPLFAYLYRDGVEISGFTKTFGKGQTSLNIEFTDANAPVGIHAYVVVISGKLVTSPILVKRVIG